MATHAIPRYTTILRLLLQYKAPRCSAVQPILDDLVAGEWEVCNNPHVEKYDRSSYKNTTTIQDIWLKYRKEGHLHPFGFKHLRLWPEGLYQLSTNCHKLQVADVFPGKSRTLLEDDYCRHPLFGPRPASYDTSHPVSTSPSPFAFRTSDVPIFVPCIEAHLNALLDQLSNEKATNTKCGNMPSDHVKTSIRYHVWDWQPTTTWLLASKVHARNLTVMQDIIKRYKRKPTVTIDPDTGSICSTIPWKLPIKFIHMEKWEEWQRSKTN